MKARKYLYSLIVILLAISSCRKDDNPRLPGIAHVPQPQFTKDETTDVSISALETDLFNATFDVDLYFKDDIKPQKLDVVVIKNGDKSNVKVLETDVTVYPSTFSITGPQLIALYEEPIVLGDRFDVGVNITTTDGKVYEAFPLYGEGFGAGVGGQPNAVPFIRYEAVCQFNIEEYTGDFIVMLDDNDNGGWGDFGEGSTVTITANGDDELMFEYPILDAEPVIVKVNTGTNTVSVARQVIGNYGTPAQGWPYGDLFVETAGGGTSNFVSPCDGTLTLNMKYTVGAGGFGEFPLIFKKK